MIDRPVRIIQITDPHLHAHPEGTLLGLNTEYSLSIVLEHIRQASLQADFILATGDITQDGSVAACTRFLTLLQQYLPIPCYWLPGNHDNPLHMAQALNQAHWGQQVIDAGCWQIILLSTHVTGRVYGELSLFELELLYRQLHDHPHKPTLIAFHHHPVAMGSEWLDAHAIRNADAFFRVIDPFPQVRAVLWGHVHQEFSLQRQGVWLWATMSTCVQFHPQQQDFGIDTQGPGYRVLDLHADGRIDTWVSRVDNIAFEIDMNAKGY